MPGSCICETPTSAKSLLVVALALLCTLPVAVSAQPEIGANAAPALPEDSSAVPVLELPSDHDEVSGAQTIDGDRETTFANSPSPKTTTTESVAEISTPAIVIPANVRPALLRPLKLAQLSSAVPFEPVVMPVQTRLVYRSRFQGFLGRIAKPIFGPVVDGLDNTASSLSTTAASMHYLQQPLDRLALPISGLAEPLSGLSQPLTGLAQPITELAQPITNLSQPVTGLQAPLRQLSESASGLGQPIRGLGDEMVGLQRPLIGIQRPLLGIQEPLRALPGPLSGLVEPLHGLQQPLVGLQRPLNGLAMPIAGLRSEMHQLRAQISLLEVTIMDIGRNVTLAIVFGCSIIAYAIWTHRRVPAAVEPTVTTMQSGHVHGSHGEEHPATIIKTGPVGKNTPPAASTGADTVEGHQDTGGSKPPGNDETPPPPTVINPPGE
jgi:hypothetical protein